MTPIKLPVSYANGRIDDADVVSILAVVQSTVVNHIPRWRSRQEQDEIGEAAARALNAAPDLTALREAARATLDWLGPVEKSPPLLPGYGLSEEARLVAERNVLRAMLAAALNLNILKDGTP